MLLIRSIAFSTMVYLFTISTVNAKTSPSITSIEQSFVNAVKSDTVPGISVAIADKDGVVWAQGFGYADLENKVLMTPKHKMRIGSVAKLITVAGMMRLYEQGKLSLDAPITTYTPSWPKKHQAISLRQLASHTSGIRHYKSSEEFLLNQTFNDVASSLTLFANDPLLFQPGQEVKYSTFAFSLMAAASEGADGKRTFKQIIQQEVFDPLNMSETAFDDQATIIPFRQRPYTANNGKLFNSPQSDHSYKYAGGGFVASPSDVSRFAVAHSHQGYLKAATLNDIFTKAKLGNGTSLPYGIGWMIGFDNFKERKYYKDNEKAQQIMASFNNAVMHSGGSNGGITMMILCRDHHRAITVVKNVDGEYSADVFLLALYTLGEFHKL